MKGKSIEKRPSGRERQAGLLGKALENGDIKIRLKKEKPAFAGFLFDDYDCVIYRDVVLFAAAVPGVNAQ